MVFQAYGWLCTGPKKPGSLSVFKDRETRGLFPHDVFVFCKSWFRNVVGCSNNHHTTLCPILYQDFWAFTPSAHGVNCAPESVFCSMGCQEKTWYQEHPLPLPAKQNCLSRGGNIAQWQRACLACVRPWGPGSLDFPIDPLQVAVPLDYSQGRTISIPLAILLPVYFITLLHDRKYYVCFTESWEESRRI